MKQKLKYNIKIYVGIISICLLMLAYSCKKDGKQYFGNPVFEGWYADPEGAVLDNKYWVFPTYSAPYEQQVFIDAFSSNDLINWNKHSKVLDTISVKWAKKAMWAPAIVENQGKFYLFFSANDIQSDKESGGIGVAVSDQPQGPYQDYLGKPLIDKFHNGAQPIDQYVFKDDDGQYYMYYGGWKRCNVAKLKDDFTGFFPFDDGSVFKEVTPDQYKEGSFMFKRNGRYYFMWSEGSLRLANYSVAYAISDSPLGPFNRIEKILEQDENVARGAGHHSVIKHPTKDDWYIVYHRRPLTETNKHSRVTCIDKMEFDENGFIKKVKITNKGVSENPL